MSRTESESSALLDPLAIKRRFLLLNQARLERLRASLTERQRDLLTLLPLLFHINHPLLPGFVNKQTPAGVWEYEPDWQALHLAKLMARSVQYSKPTRPQHPILALYLMGSAGTIGYANDSDLDIWVCLDPKLATHDRELLRQKCKRLETWAASQGAELHLYLLDSEAFRRGEGRDGLDSEGCGTAQHNLLLDEFYRTGILIQGQPPLWWLVPPEMESRYDDYVAELQHKRFLHARHTLDFGGLANIPAEEFFGAALWQAYKAVDSPYKSLLKLLLLEAYASEFPRIELLSLGFKQAVYNGSGKLDQLDPYMMMLDKVEGYLVALGDQARLQLARRCVYIKSGIELSQQSSSESWRRELLAALTNEWQWPLTEMLRIDSRRDWKVPQVIEERRLLFDALTKSYRFLSDFARQQSGLTLITQEDLTLLGRKLHAAFERKAGKIEILNRGIAEDLRESHLSLHEVVSDKLQSSWLLFQGRVVPEQLAFATPLKRSRSVVELIAWCYFNTVLDRQCVLMVYASSSELTAHEFRLVVERMHQQLPLELLKDRGIDDYAGAAQVMANALYVNVAVPPLDGYTQPSEIVIASHVDALSYGGSASNLLLTLDQVVVTSWHEVLCQRYLGARGLVEWLRDYLRWWPPSQEQEPQSLQAFGLTTHRGQEVARRLVQLFDDICACYYRQHRPESTRYIFAVCDGFFVCRFHDDLLHYEELDNRRALLRYLGEPQPRYSDVVIDRYALADTVLPLLYAHNTAGRIQFFYRRSGEMVEIFVLDERGSLHHQLLPYYDAQMLINQYADFFAHAVRRFDFLQQEGVTPQPPAGVDFFAIVRGHGEQHLLRQQPSAAVENPGYFTLQVMVEKDLLGETAFTLYCNDQEFSTLEYGSALFDAVVRHVLRLRRESSLYPIYITDISLSRAVVGEELVSKIQTIHLLKYKQKIEEQLNRHLSRAR